MSSLIDQQIEFRDQLFGARLLCPTGVDGIYLRSGQFEAIVGAIDRAVSVLGADQAASSWHFPLVVPRRLIEQTDYVRSFADLSGIVSTYEAGPSEYGKLVQALESRDDWTALFESSDLALCSAACHPLYPSLPEYLARGGERYEVFGNCFRHEPSSDPLRMQVFRQHEFVYVGNADLAQRHRDEWVERALALHGSFGLDVRAVPANDPFFGRAGEMLAANQIAEELKIEIVCAIFDEESPTAISSANCHRDHFGIAFGIHDESGEIAHSACVGFGVERIALALLRTHGLDVASWPAGLLRRLGL